MTTEQVAHTQSGNCPDCGTVHSDYADCPRWLAKAPTPGPWTSVKLATSNTFDIRPATGPEVATVWDCNGDNAVHCEANARLIAAAPELLEALKALESLIEPKSSIYKDPNVAEWVKFARAAISKVEHGQ